MECSSRVFDAQRIFILARLLTIIAGFSIFFSKKYFRTQWRRIRRGDSETAGVLYVSRDASHMMELLLLCKPCT